MDILFSRYFYYTTNVTKTIEELLKEKNRGDGIVFLGSVFQYPFSDALLRLGIIFEFSDHRGRLYALRYVQVTKPVHDTNGGGQRLGLDWDPWERAYELIHTVQVDDLSRGRSTEQSPPEKVSFSNFNLSSSSDCSLRADPDASPATRIRSWATQELVTVPHTQCHCILSPYRVSGYPYGREFRRIFRWYLEIMLAGEPMGFGFGVEPGDVRDSERATSRHGYFAISDGIIM